LWTAGSARDAARVALAADGHAIRRALVTGASSGIGAATARALARRGVEVFAAARRIDELRRVAESCRGRVHPCVLDICDPRSVASLSATLHTVTNGDGVDALVNAAGWATIGPLETVAPEDLSAQLDVSALGPLRVVQAVLPAMLSRRAGRIVNVSSILGLRVIAGHGAYCAGKFALEGLTESLRQELAPHGVEVALVEPGSVRTDFSDLAADDLHARVGDDPRWQAALQRLVALRRRMTAAGVEPEVVADAIVTMLAAPRMPVRRIVPRRGRVQAWSLGVARPLLRRLGGHFLGPSTPRGRAASPGSPVVLLTGAAGGIGGLAALELATAGARVFATDIDRDGLSALVGAARSRGVSIAPSTMDVTDPAQIRITVAAIERATDGHGVDVVVNAAGYAELGPLALVSEAAMKRQLDVNVLGLFATTRAVLPAMRRRGSGRIVDVSSVAGLVGFPFMGLYHASKFAVEALDEAWRQELHAAGIRVVSVTPAFIRTGFSDTARATTRAYDASATPWAPAWVPERIDRVIARLSLLGGEPIGVARAIKVAALGRAPRARYAVPWTGKAAALLLPRCPAWITDRVWARVFELPRAHADS
jgi:NADP-dependent 3-hydroxy acid dehydrogenase YdfG